MIISKLKALVVTAGLAALFVSSAFAGGATVTQYSPGSQSAVLSVPTAATCQQAAAQYGTGATTNNGPLGNYTISWNQYPNSIYLSAPVSAGNYPVYVSVSGSGYSVVVINW